MSWGGIGKDGKFEWYKTYNNETPKEGKRIEYGTECPFCGRSSEDNGHIEGNLTADGKEISGCVYCGSEWDEDGNLI
jgi:hypothetical protein